MGRDSIPGLAKVARAEEILRADIYCPVPRRTYVNRSVPIEAELLLLVARQWLDGPRLVRLAVDAPDLTALVFGVDVVLIGGIYEHPESVAAIHVLPAAAGDAARVLRISDPRAVVLQPTVNVVRTIVVDTHMVELRDRQVVRLPPFVAAVEGIPDAAIVAGDDAIGGVRIDPEIVEVPVRSIGDSAEALAAVITYDEWTVGLEQAVSLPRALRGIP